MKFQEIIEGKEEITALSPPTLKTIATPISCQDGTDLSVQASAMHYCTPRTDTGPYTCVEVGYPSIQPPQSWAQYADGDYPSDVYGWVPVELVREFIQAHGGEVE